MQASLFGEDSLTGKTAGKGSIILQPAIGGSIPASSLQFERCDLRDIRRFVETYHYSHNLDGVKTSYCFAALSDRRELVGACVLGPIATPAWRKYAPTEKQIIELRRLVFLDQVGKNAESKFVGWVIRWLKKNARHLSTIISYADPYYGHKGTIYRASGFSYLGVSSPNRMYMDEDGKLYHSRTLTTQEDWSKRSSRLDESHFCVLAKILRAKRRAGKLRTILTPPKHRYIKRLRPFSEVAA